MLLQFLLVDKAGWNLRNRVAHTLIRQSDGYGLPHILLLIMIILKLAKNEYAPEKKDSKKSWKELSDKSKTAGNSALPKVRALHWNIAFPVSIGSGLTFFNLAFVLILYIILSIWLWIQAGSVSNSLTFGNAKRKRSCYDYPTNFK